LLIKDAGAFLNEKKGKQNNAYLFLSTDLREKIQVEPLRDLARDSGQHKLTYKNQSLTKRKQNYIIIIVLNRTIIRRYKKE